MFAELVTNICFCVTLNLSILLIGAQHLSPPLLYKCRFIAPLYLTIKPILILSFRPDMSLSCFPNKILSRFLQLKATKSLMY